jgi:hypothetical protein
MRLIDAIADLDGLPRKATIYVPGAAPTITRDTEVVLVPSGGDVPDGWIYLLELLIVREVLEVWSAWRGGRAPSPDEASDAVIYYAEYDAYQPTPELAP